MGLLYCNVHRSYKTEGVAMQTLKDVLGRAEERSNLKSLVFVTALVVGLVMIVFGIAKFQFLFEAERGGGTESIEETSALSADQGGG